MAIGHTRERLGGQFRSRRIARSPLLCELRREPRRSDPQTDNAKAIYKRPQRLAPEMDGHDWIVKYGRGDKSDVKADAKRRATAQYVIDASRA